MGFVNYSKLFSDAYANSGYDYEFGGPVGAAVTTVLLPVLVLLLGHFARVGAVDLSFVPDPDEMTWRDFLESPVLCPSCSSSAGRQILYHSGAGIVLWFLWQVILERWLPCELVSGAPVSQHPEKITLQYRINGHLAFWLTILLVTIGWPTYDQEASTSVQFGAFPYWSLMYEYFGELALATIIVCFVGSTYIYADSYRGEKVLAAGGDSGNIAYDFFIGRELNPRIGTFDWKEFCELRPGLIGWVLLNAASAHKQFSVQGSVSGSMLLVNVFHGVYVWDALYQEKAILTTMDITTDGFGFMLFFGDLCWVPFTYSLQARYLVNNDPGLSGWALLAIVALHGLGYAIFRGANGQKDAFRRNPDDPAVSHLTFLQTKRGTKLLTSGWWGMARKINYTGDFVMGLSWCLTCGFGSIVPYYYAIYFMILLVHRSIRDDHMCQVKYGEDWDTYKQLVPYRFIPGLV